MTETAVGEVPVLAIGREQTQQWVAALLGTAQVVAYRRERLGRMAWSEIGEADRLADTLAAAVDPAVRTMSPDEHAAFLAALRGDPRAHRPPGGGVQTRVVTHPGAGTVRATVAAMPRRGPDGPWGLLVEVGAAGGPVVVRCRDEAVAKRLADDVLARGPAATARLARYATAAAERAVAAAGDVREPEPLRLARAAAAIRAAWSQRPELAEAVIAPTAAQRAAGHVWNPAFKALAQRLVQTEERGYAMADVARWLDPARLHQRDVDNPAALAEHLVAGLLAQLPLVNLDDPPRRAHAHDRAAASDARADAPAGTAQRTAPVRPEIDAALAAALPEDVAARVRASRRYGQLGEQLAAAESCGEQLGKLLADLPTERIAAAAEPAAYLGAVLRRRVERGEPPRVLPDRAAMRGLLEHGLPSPLADKVLAARSWPGLANRLARWNSDGLPVTELLAGLPHHHIDAARDPAAYLTAVMNRRVTATRGGRDNTPEAAAREHVRGERPGGEQNAAVATPEASVAPDGTRRGAPGPARAARPAPTLDSHPDHPDHGPVGELTEEVFGDLAPVQTLEHPLSPSRPAGRPGGATGEASGHRGAAEASEARAVVAERAAAAGREQHDLPGTAVREDLDGADLAHVAARDAAAAHAVAADERAAATAAAHRAALTFLPEAGHEAPAAAAASRRPGAGGSARSARPRPTPQPRRERGRTR